MPVVRYLARIAGAVALAGAGAIALYAAIVQLADASFGDPQHLPSVLAVQFFLTVPAYRLIQRAGFLAEKGAVKR